jgi:hypothetical protein
MAQEHYRGFRIALVCDAKNPIEPVLIPRREWPNSASTQFTARAKRERADGWQSGAAT